MTRIMISHDSPIISQHINYVLGGEPDFEIVGQHDSFHELSADKMFSHLLHARCDLLLVSGSLPKETLQQLMQLIRTLPTPCKVLMLGVPNQEEAILDCLEEGTNGYLCENEGMAELVKKIRCLIEDEFIIEPHIGALLIARISQLKQLVNELDGGNIARPQESYAELTQREWEVLRLLGQEYSNQQIAEQLTIELGTVKNHVHNLLRKLDVYSRKQAAQLARQLFSQATPGDQEPSYKTFDKPTGWQTFAPLA